VLYEEVFWPMNGTALGRTRCNVTSYVTDCSLQRASQRLDSGGQVANKMNIGLLSREGEFADDQFGAFDAANSVYNGTTSQKYLTKRTPVCVEAWYGNEFEPVFVGRVDEQCFTRSTPVGGVSSVSISCIDQVAEMANRVLRKSRVFDDYDICDPASEATSLLHAITRLATEREVYNYCANSSFENATIGNSWLVTGGTLTNEVDPLLGTKCAQLANATGGTKKLYQIVDFTGSKKLNIGERWTFGIWLKSAGAATGDVRIQEYAAAVAGTAATGTYTLAGGDFGYQTNDYESYLTLAGGLWPDVRLNGYVQVTYKGGWAAIPGDVVLGAIEQARVDLLRMSGEVGVTSRGAQGESTARKNHAYTAAVRPRFCSSRRSASLGSRSTTRKKSSSTPSACLATMLWRSTSRRWQPTSSGRKLQNTMRKKPKTSGARRPVASASAAGRLRSSCCSVTRGCAIAWPGRGVCSSKGEACKSAPPGRAQALKGLLLLLVL
jgi:hypothetical protein